LLVPDSALLGVELALPLVGEGALLVPDSALLGVELALPLVGDGALLVPDSALLGVELALPLVGEGALLVPDSALLGVELALPLVGDGALLLPDSALLGVELPLVGDGAPPPIGGDDEGTLLPGLGAVTSSQSVGLRLQSQPHSLPRASSHASMTPSNVGTHKPLVVSGAVPAPH